MKHLALLTILFGLPLGFLPACIQIVLNFPAEEIEASADDIIDDVRPDDVEAIPPSAGGDLDVDGGASAAMPGSGRVAFASVLPIDLRLVALTVFAAEKESDKVKNDAVVKSIREQLKKRFPRLLYFYDKAALGENRKGLVEARPAELSLKDKNALAKLIKAENKDRMNLYKRIAKIEAVDPSQIIRIQKIYAALWIKKARKGWWVQDAKKKWIKKAK
jgi:uncharacterized protein YdbL (DUF1318 family)